MSKVRVRFAPSPTGGLHLGGVRTALYNYLFAKKHGGDFIVRIEDTDQTRFVPGAEQYIFDCLRWCGIEPDESPEQEEKNGPYYRQSKRKEQGIYQKYAEQLVKDGYAYYAFDTQEELETMRSSYKSEQNPSPQYDCHVRMKMRNSLSLLQEETNKLLVEGTKYVIRIKMPENETVSFTDMIRGEIKNETSLVDDKVLLKADGMPTYHLAVVVDDYEMQISHAFRGEEWLPSAPVHILLWKYLFGLNKMPQWAHLPLILGPNGKLSKRDGAKYGFPVFAMNWPQAPAGTDPSTNELTEGFKEKGFLPEAFINFLAVLGWNDGTEQEIFTKEELIEKFSMDRVHKAGAKFDYEKAKWFNHEWIKKLVKESINKPEIAPSLDQWSPQTNQQIPQKQSNNNLYGESTVEPFSLASDVKRVLMKNDIPVPDDNYLKKVIGLVGDRCTLVSDFVQQASYFFKDPDIDKLDINAVKPKWDEAKKAYFETLLVKFREENNFSAEKIELIFKNLSAEKNIKLGELQMIFRVMLVGTKIGPGVFIIAEMIGKSKTLGRIQNALTVF